ncbi:C4-dicarboxylate ABC transporter permease [Salipaludibacillus keqinensis]|uniref:C4-dicarboxylate ABC transporter permease n=1 Tax=Salipaludibacillus keqinensis TaxID=2045207 RepID=A0A323TLA8_9BACI|nr:TRAP transporter large permease subunit [Salipaludibacillus keqinensis]PYZ93343.1 C4-dicarboxylate ABC transporter permease [Salipaludibacillus keqinensis]
MEWYTIILLFFVLLIFFVLIGVPIAFAFITVNIILSTIFIGFSSGAMNLVNSAFSSMTSFSITPIPLFILMGEVLFHSGLVLKMLDVISKLLGKLPSRLSILANITGTMFAALSGSAVANAAMLGSALTPEMLRRGYHIKMIIGPILAAGSLAIIIPPSTVTILLGSVGQISVGDLLIAGILPGLMITVMFLIYYIFLGVKNPSLAPRYEIDNSTWKERIRLLIQYVLPAVLLIGTVLGLIFFGIATPTESAAIGALGSIILPMFYGRFNKKMIQNSVLGTLKISSMILLILAASAGFSQLLAFSGATRGLISVVLALDIPSIVTIIFMLLVILLLGTFIEPMSIVMITIPLFVPVVAVLGYDLVWFGIIALICLSIGNVTPPFGMLLFTIKGVIPSSVTLKEVYKSVINVVVIQMIAVIILILFPEIVTWLPSLRAN